jgi:hypothetical protein
VEITDLLTPLVLEIKVLVTVVDYPERAFRLGVEGYNWQNNLFLIEQESWVSPRASEIEIHVGECRRNVRV